MTADMPIVGFDRNSVRWVDQKLDHVAATQGEPASRY
jgi:hypothetical protein